MSIPNYITYDIESVKYYKQYNVTSVIEEEALECIQNYTGLLVNFTQWYSGVVTYFIPSLVLIYCHIKIVIFMFKNSTRLAAIVNNIYIITVMHSFEYGHKPKTKYFLGGYGYSKIALWLL